MGESKKQIRTVMDAVEHMILEVPAGFTSVECPALTNYQIRQVALMLESEYWTREFLKPKKEKT